ncbi:hypothetical protein KDW_63800 [Dictyobacter vulcani]|uniref:N-acetyltransferase domain-containing protein n=1 Tax=Dictyobacter vulcani TaxID=2607529 RepID=A0A5J4KR82_9CHLR|nr:GNAT family N-acetyltransferase [Dictyobacter vulcani]GER92218.1 hypothetical protein KDW_63800 [Dictyobacter vulcani]
MNSQQILVTSVTDARISAIIDLVWAQGQRWHQLDSRLNAISSKEQIASMIQHHRSQEQLPLVAVDTQNRVRAYVHPAIWQLDPEDGLRAFFSDRNGLARYLTLPDPDDADAFLVVSTLFAELTQRRNGQRIRGEIVYWPSCDLWLDKLLHKQGYLLDSELAYQRFPIKISEPPHSYSGTNMQSRLACRDDEDVLAALFTEELVFHEPYTPFVHMNPAVEQAFRDRLSLLWAGKSLEEGAPLVVVIELDGRVVAMSESDLYIVNEDEKDASYLLPAGRYCHINNMGVCQELRGQGIGHMLVKATVDLFEPMNLDGSILWFNPDNPLSSRFWPRLGFQPLWRTYQRHYANRSNPLF